MNDAIKFDFRGNKVPATIKSIAAEAGVSYQAVSAVLNGKTNCRVSPQRREEILRIARESGYRPNFGYRLMRGKATHTVAIVSGMRQIESDEHVRELLLKLMQELNSRGYATYFNNMMTPDADNNLREIRDLITRGAEHFIFIGSPMGHFEIEAELLKNNRTFIGWNSYFSRNLQSGSIEASTDILRFLIEQTGEIPQLILPAPVSTNCARYLALQTILAEKNISDSINDYIISTPQLDWEEKNFNIKAFELGYKGTKIAFSRNTPPKALAYFTDKFALGGIMWLHEHNIRIGKDVFLSGFNNIEAICTNPYPVASAEHPVTEAIEILLEQMDKNQPFSRHLKLKLHLRPENKTTTPNKGE
ncbi:MAG: LacI family transcriptional regulator [Lentisphaerae bacterium]|nr:LacI family transcriptional regulator [Lentisphaerota bacterium]